MRAVRLRRLWFAVLAAAVLVGDQWSKAEIVRSLQEFTTVPVLSPIVYLYHTSNDGVAWSLFRGHAWIFSVVALVFSIGILVVGRSAVQRSAVLATALALLLGGSVGNLIDRLRLGYVIDFIDVRIPLGGGHYYRWPTFNVADSSICIGMGLLMICFWFLDRPDTQLPPNTTRVSSSDSGNTGG